METVEAEVVGEELETRQVSIARPVITPDEAREMVTELRQLISKILVKDKHYMSIRGRDVLLKAGAEELGKFFGLSTAYHDLDTKTEEGVFYASVKCSVSNADGRILAESYGFYGSDEHKGKAPQNTIVKMSQKRAYVGAILTATGTSELFTQDAEDDAPPAAVVEDQLPSDADLLAVAELYAQKKPATIEEGAAWIASYPEKAQSRAWVARQALNLLTRPDPLPIEPTPRPDDLARTGLGPEPEIPVEEPIPGQTTIDDAPTGVIESDDYPF